MAPYDPFENEASFNSRSFEADLLSDPSFTPFSDSALDILQALSDHHQKTQTLVKEQPQILVEEQPQTLVEEQPQTLVEEQPHSLEQSSPPNLVYSSSRSFQSQSVSLYQGIDFNSIENDQILENFLQDYSVRDTLESLEKCSSNPEQCRFEQNNGNQVPSLYSYSGGAENVAEYMQNNYSSNSFDGQQPGFVSQPCFDSFLESPNLQTQAASLSSPESSYLTSNTTRDSGTRDLQNVKTIRSLRELSPMELARVFKNTRYPAEERKERISKYKAKKQKRNYKKTIKYACRKSLADRRPRKSGRFVRYEQAGRTLQPASPTREEEEDDEQWIERLNADEEVGETTVRGEEQFIKNNSGSTVPVQ